MWTVDFVVCFCNALCVFSREFMFTYYQYQSLTISFNKKVTQHMVSHANSKKIGCSKCPATFTNSANLRSHLKAHYGIKDCCCEICGKVNGAFKINLAMRCAELTQFLFDCVTDVSANRCTEEAHK